MTFPSLGRAMVLALSLLGASCGSVFAHALPGSLLTLSRDGAQLGLSIRLPLEDLIVAAPSFQDFETLAQDRPLSPENTQRVAAYFAHHLQLGNAAGPLPLSVAGASLLTW